jgi:hypothetical protein
MLAGERQPPWREKLRALIDRRRRWLLIALLVIVLFPVRQSALAPAEIVAHEVVRGRLPVGA